MSSIGIRVYSDTIYYSIVDGTINNAILKVNDVLSIPKAFEGGQAFAWVRSNILNICREFNITNGIIRTFETKSPMAKKAIAKRSRLEGVIAEALFSQGVNSKICMLATMSSLLKIQDKKSAKCYLDLEEFRGIDKWSDYKGYSKESIMAAVAALGL